MDSFRVVHDAPRIVFLFGIASYGTLHDFKGFQLLLGSISVSFCDLGEELYIQDLVKFSQHSLFQEIFKMAGLAPASEDVR